MAGSNVPYVLDPKPGVTYTQRSERKAVVVYRSLMEAVHDAETPEAGNALLRDFLDCSFGYVQLEELAPVRRMLLRGYLVGSDAAADRYDERCADGRRGGRPPVELDPEELKQDYHALGSWEKVAEKHGVSRRAIYNERRRWDEGDLGKNLNNKNKNKKKNKNTITKKTDRPAGRSGAQSAVVSEEEVAEANRKLKRAYDKLHEHQERQST